VLTSTRGSALPRGAAVLQGGGKEWAGNPYGVRWARPLKRSPPPSPAPAPSRCPLR